MTKKSSSILFFLISLFVISCQIKNVKTGNFALLPTPQHFEILGNSELNYQDIHAYYLPSGVAAPVFGKILQHIEKASRESEAQILCNIDASLNVGSEGYTLEISRDRIQLIGKDNAGLFYAVKTLEQLLEDAKEQDVPLPACSIRDYSLLAYRAVHLDMKHHLERREYYYKIIDRLATYKVNAIIAEMEDKLKYERRPLIGSADALSIKEWQDLSSYAIERNIEISPLIQGLGHASFILKHDKYKELRDDPNSDWAFNPLNPETYELQFDLYLDAIEATPHGRFLHVGGDEVRTTGRGSGRSSLELQLIWLNKVCKFAEEHGRIPIFWDDMPLKHAGVYRPMFNPKLTQQEVEKIWQENEHKLIQFLDQFPKNCIYMRWNYSSPQAIGNSKAMEWFRSHGLKVMGATAGQTRWFLMPQNESNIENIRVFATTSIESDLEGLLLTLWDDDSPHFELYGRGILAFAEYTWAGNRRSKEEIKKVYRHREFSAFLEDEAYAFIDQLEKPVAFYKNALVKGNKRNYLKKSPDAINELIIDLPDRKNKGDWKIRHNERIRQAASVLESGDRIGIIIRQMKSKAVRNRYTLEVYEQVNTLVQFVANILVTLNEFDSAQSAEEEREALEKLKRLPENFRSIRETFERVYSKTRVLSKPEGYVLDQDHHVHLANQTVSFDWQFLAEILFLQKLENWLR